MFLPSVLLMNSTCLPEFWQTSYPAYSAVFFLLGILSTHLIQIILTMKMTSRSVKKRANHKTQGQDTLTLKDGLESSTKNEVEIRKDTKTSDSLTAKDTHNQKNHHPNIQNQDFVESSGSGCCVQDHVEHHIDLGVLDTDEYCGEDSAHHPNNNNSNNHHTHGLSLLKERQLSVYLLEIGIFSHSVLIGITLGIAGSEFVSLLIALCFHQ